MAAVQQNMPKLSCTPGLCSWSGILERASSFHEMRRSHRGGFRSHGFRVLDTRIRKSCPFPPEILERGRAMIVECDPGI
jgi:hypothetical protein